MDAAAIAVAVGELVHELRRAESPVEQLAGLGVAVVRHDFEIELVHGLQGDAVALTADLALGFHEPEFALQVLGEIGKTHNAIE